MQRRQLLSLLTLGSSAAPFMARPAFAQSYPSKPLRLVVGFPPGGGIDFAARSIQSLLETALKQPVVVDNKPGGGGTKAAQDLTRAEADGHTLLVANTGPFAIAPHLIAKLPYDTARQFSYIGQITEASYIAVTHADHPANTLKAFVEWARANPGKANFASGGPGSSTHLNGELLNAVTGLDIEHVPYKGSAPAVQDLIGGQVHLLIDSGAAVLPQIKSGRLKALAVTGSRRDPGLPDIATAAEQGLVGMESVGFQGIVGPAGLPKDIVDRLAAELKKIIALPDVRAKFAAAGSETHWRGPVEFAAHVKKESDKWAALIKKRNIKAE